MYRVILLHSKKTVDDLHPVAWEHLTLRFFDFCQADGAYPVASLDQGAGLGRVFLVS